MRPNIRRTTTQVPIRGGEDVVIEPDDPWPSAYRGSKYSLVRSRKHNKRVMAWKYDDLQIFLDPPDGLVDSMRDVGKSDGDGRGSFRITAGGEILTKVRAESYKHAHRAPANRGWIPVYLGKLEGDIELDGIEIQPRASEADPLTVWEGLPFHHGERWTVSVNDELIWKWNDYRFESAFDHSDLVAKYGEFRKTPGRLYVNEYGHVWANIPPSSVPARNREMVNEMFTKWRNHAQRNNKNTALRLVQRRLEATGGGRATDGQLPAYLGHVSRFDEGTVPRPVVDDMRYFEESGRERED